MRFAQSSAVYFNYSLQHAIRDLHDLGYDAIEIWGGRPHMYRNDLDEQMDEIVALLAECEMRVCNFIPAQFRYPSILCSDNETVRGDSVEYIKAAMDNAVKVGSPSVSLCPGMSLFGADLDGAWKRLLDSYGEIARYNEDKGLDLLIEPAHRFESNLILTVDDCLRMIEQLQSADFGILLDTGHCNVNGEDFRQVIPRCGPLPFHIHLDDNDGGSDAHLIPGEGGVDFRAMVEALNGIGYDGVISAELGGAYIMDPTSACRRTLLVLREMFA